MWSVCIREIIYTRGTSVYSLTRRTFVESAHDLTLEKYQGWRKAWLARNGRPSMWWTRSVVFILAFAWFTFVKKWKKKIIAFESEFLLCASPPHSRFYYSRFVWFPLCSLCYCNVSWCVNRHYLEYSVVFMSAMHGIWRWSVLMFVFCAVYSSRCQ